MELKKNKMGNATTQWKIFFIRWIYFGGMLATFSTSMDLYTRETSQLISSWVIRRVVKEKMSYSSVEHGTVNHEGVLPTTRQGLKGGPGIS